MADEGPPKPKPKPGSLKDRIKQFETSSSSSSNSPVPPPLRPKPGTLGQWKPKPLDPPSPNKQATFSVSSQDTSQTSEDHVAHAQGSGMSATDAMSSISKGGGSLKERMAALQGKGAFGDASASSAPPLPSSEGKPRVWRASPAPPIELKQAEEITDNNADKFEDIGYERSPIEPSPLSPADESKRAETAGGATGEGTAEEGNEGEPKTEEELERERRAAIAARMARLGGARVGMPVGFGIAAKGLHGGAKPNIPTKPRILTPGGTGSAGSSAPTSALSPAPTSALSPAPTSSLEETEKVEPGRQTTLDTALKVPLPKSQGSLLTPGSMDDPDAPSESDATASGKLVPPRSPAIPKSPESMPIPALPKRAAGPRRKKSAKELKPTSGSTGEAETPAIPLPEPAQLVDEPQIVAPTHQEGTSASGTGNNGDLELKEEAQEATQANDDPTEEPASVLDDLASVAPSEAVTPPPPSPSVLATEDEDAESMGDHPSRRPTIEVPAHERKIVEEEGSELLTPHPRSSSSEDMGGASLSIAIASTMQAEPEPTEEKDTEHVTGQADEEEGEAARRKRVAEKMARIGAVNPFSPGGFKSPVSPQDDKRGQADVKKEEDISEEKKLEEESDQAVVTKKTADNDSDVDLAAAHESEPNVHVLSQLQTPLSAAAVMQDEESDRNAGVGVLAETQEALDDVEYPMMSPLVEGQSEAYIPFALAHSRDEPVTHEHAAVEPSSRYDDEKESSEEDNETAETETIHDGGKPGEDGSHPRHISRAIPPPPPAADGSYSTGAESSSAERSSSMSPDFSPTAYDLENSSPHAALATALARRAPVPPPGNQPVLSPQVQTHSISPTPSPPPRPFVREGAPSPPSLDSLSNAEDEEEEYYDEEEDYLEEVSQEQEEAEGTPTEEHDSSPVIEEQVRPPSPPPAIKTSPPPLPGGRPPIPAVPRSIPPPPRHALPPPPTSNVATRPPAPIPKQSIMMAPGSPSNDKGDEPGYGANLVTMEDKDAKSLRRATERPALPPPRSGLGPEHALRPNRGLPGDREIMDDEEGDPVDPGFVGTRSSPHEGGIVPAQTRETAIPYEQEGSSEAADPELDAEAARRRTIAERMAKLGGIKFGVPVAARPPPVRKHSESGDMHAELEGNESNTGTEVDVDSNQTPEEAERTRRAGLAARMAAMGGRGLGMYGGGVMPSPASVPGVKASSPPPIKSPPSAPMASPPPIPGPRPKRQSRDDVAHAITRPPPPAPANDMVSNTGGGETSESEVEMVTAEIEEEGEMVEEVEDEEPELVETPPPPPNRPGRPPVPPASRPPPPVPRTDAAGPSLPAGRRAPPASPTNEYEVVEDESQAAPRASHPRAIPASNPSASSPSMESSGQWELPNIPSGSFDLGNYGKGARQVASTAAPENDASWTKVDQDDSNAHPKAPISAQPSAEPFTGPDPPPISAEALVGLARRLGPTIVSSAQHVHEKSKRLVIGDGSSTSFLHMVLSPISGVSISSFGHMVYVQAGGAVQKRLGDIMPGDVIALYEARFKGHKGGLGLGAYSVSWGTKEEPVLGVVSEFEGKKNKIKAFAVNQHPNSYPTIDTPSYKLDDLKGGTLKVFRVAESS